MPPFVMFVAAELLRIIPQKEQLYFNQYNRKKINLNSYRAKQKSNQERTLIVYSGLHAVAKNRCELRSVETKIRIQMK